MSVVVMPEWTRHDVSPHCPFVSSLGPASVCFGIAFSLAFCSWEMLLFGGVTNLGETSGTPRGSALRAESQWGA